MRRGVMVAAGMWASATMGCGSDGAGATPGDAGATADVARDAGQATDAGSSTAGLRTLATCKTDIAADAPEFFKRYFKCVTITTTATDVIIASEGLPPHKTNYWKTDDPNWEAFDTSRGAMYRENPNKIVGQSVKLTIPKAPVAKSITITSSFVDGMVGTNGHEYPMGPVGVALDSVPLFNPLAAPGDDIENEKYTFDRYDAHPAPGGAYHYHTASAGPLEVLKSIGAVTQATPGGAEVELFGVMCDGAVVMGCKELDGTAPSGALDPQGGHVHDLVDKAGIKLLEGRYHTHVCPSSAGARRFTPEIQYYTKCAR